ncbi:acyltransferase, partial [Salmonella sp. s58078]|uniref:acyltransferase n=1 Tax=Salmonella sp. s58078 TaxID=3159699 RepID=UPI00397ED409
MFEWLDLYYPASGRIRRSENGRPFIKCNDGGVRIVEAKCDRSIDEWLGSKDRCKNDEQLVPSQVLGPELEFSPLVYLQFTRFICGGLSVGLSW